MSNKKYFHRRNIDFHMEGRLRVDDDVIFLDVLQRYDENDLKIDVNGTTVVLGTERFPVGGEIVYVGERADSSEISSELLSETPDTRHLEVTGIYDGTEFEDLDRFTRTYVGSFNDMNVIYFIFLVEPKKEMHSDYI